MEISEKWLCDFMLSDGRSFVLWALVMGVQVEQLTSHGEQGNANNIVTTLSELI